MGRKFLRPPTRPWPRDRPAPPPGALPPCRRRDEVAKRPDHPTRLSARTPSGPPALDAGMRTTPQANSPRPYRPRPGSLAAARGATRSAALRSTPVTGPRAPLLISTEATGVLARQPLSRADEPTQTGFLRPPSLRRRVTSARRTRQGDDLPMQAWSPARRAQRVGPFCDCTTLAGDISSRTGSTYISEDVPILSGHFGTFSKSQAPIHPRVTAAPENSFHFVIMTHPETHTATA